MSSNDMRVTPFDYGNVSHSAYEDRIMYQLPAWYYFLLTVLPITVLSGIVFNVFGLVITVRNRMSQRHEGYLYLTAIFIANTAILIFEPGVYWIMSLDTRYNPVYISSFVQSLLQAFKTIIYSCGWLSVALMFNVYLRDRKTPSSRCGCSPSFAAKYCTLRATSIIVGIIFGFILGSAVSYLLWLVLSDDGHYRHGLIPLIKVDFVIVPEILIMWIIPFIFFLPVVLLLTVCRSRPTEGRTVDDDQFRKAALILSSMTFFIQFILVVVEIVLQILFTTSGYDIDRAIDSYRLFLIAFDFVLSLSLAVQPVICILVIKQFKDGFYSVMPCCKRNSKDYTVSGQNYGQDIQLTDSA